MTHPEVSKVAARLRQEYVVRVEGMVRARKDPNARMATGAVEVLATQVRVEGKGLPPGGQLGFKGQWRLALCAGQT